MSWYEFMKCQYIREWLDWDECYIEKYYVIRCMRCSYVWYVEVISIYIYEWFLFYDVLVVFLIVFEFMVFLFFGNWCDVIIVL